MVMFNKSLCYKGGKVINILVWILFGALAGWIISLLVSTNSVEKSVRYIVIGIVGALAGGILTKIFNNESIAMFNSSAVFIAVLSSLVLLGAVRKFYT